MGCSLLADLFRRGYDEWYDTAQQIIDQVCLAKESIYLWPFLRMPRLRKWYTRTGGVPPSSGQGVSQALKDVQSLILVLSRSSDLLDALEAGQDMRQSRIKKIFDWATNVTNVQRMPAADRERLLGQRTTKTRRVVWA